MGSSIPLQSLEHCFGISISKDDTDFSKKVFRTSAISLSSNIIISLSIIVNVLYKMLLLVKKSFIVFQNLFVIGDIFGINPFIKAITEGSFF